MASVLAGGNMGHVVLDPSVWAGHATEVLFARPTSLGMFDTQIGTAFAIRHNGADWLVTCAHNVETADLALTGKLEFPVLRFLQPSPSVLDAGDGRRVVFIRRAATIVDALAIELRPGELPVGLVPFPGTKPIQSSGTLSSSLPPHTTVFSPDGSRGVRIPTSGHLVVVGFNTGLGAGLDKREPATVVATHLLDGLPTVQPWMSSYAPAALKGASGGPVMEILSPNTYKLWGIHTHGFDAQLSLMVDGQPGEMSLRCGAGVPVGLLIDALPAATHGVCCIDV